jgi:crotonobetainyl-CoA:carnitine CoA-transferase CaiB-like acyl-CoA transferase
VSGPLAGIRVIDLTTYLSGPYGTQLLSGMGADVIKVERPDGGDPARRNPPYAGTRGIHFGRPGALDESLSNLKRNRRKRSITIDLSRPEGLEILHALLADADVLAENFTPGTLARLGLDPGELTERYPRLVIVSVSGFGQTGPYARRPAFDLVVQALSGAMAVTGERGGEPLRAGIALGDLAAGMMATIGVLAALREREVSGCGQHVDVSMLDTLVSMVLDEAPDVLEREGRPLRTGNRRTRLTPFNVYGTADGAIAIATASDAHWRSLLRAMGRDDLVESGFHATLESRFEHADDIDAFVEAWTRERDATELVERLAAAGVAASKVATLADVARDPQLQSRGMIQPVIHPRSEALVPAMTYGFPIRFSRSEADLDTPAPALGQHTVEVLRDIAGLDAARIAELAERGVI